MSCNACFWRVQDDGPCPECRQREDIASLQAENIRLRARVEMLEKALSNDARHGARVLELSTALREARTYNDGLKARLEKLEAETLRGSVPVDDPEFA